ncbi:MAG TPA: CHAT domain-containing protein [Pyrinomonadaceae bacterium]|nr:CHAT domain-containing protein [Pyrinomonadaceae bacterium]
MNFTRLAQETNMFDERAFITEVEQSGSEELANILMHPSYDEEKALRTHLGEQRYQRMHSMALKRRMSRGLDRKPKGNVVVIHGIMGAELSVSSGGNGDITWVNAFRIMRGWLDRLRLNDDGRGDYNGKFKVSASGIMKRYYGELLLSLSENWNTHAFWFDWRKDLSMAADDLNAKINEWFGGENAVHIVAHSMGGLVARTFIKKYGERWEKMWDAGDAATKRAAGTAGGRLVMLGTPNYGSFAIPQVITGIEGLVRKLSVLDLRHNMQDLLLTFNSFVGSYQMLPSPEIMPEMLPLYDAATYSGYNVPPQHLTTARQSHEFLRDVVDARRMVYVAGFDQPTYSGIKKDLKGNWQKLDSTDSYEVTMDGDGRVPHLLGLLQDSQGKKPVQTYYIRDDHGNLSTNSEILGALDELLQTGKTNALDSDLARAKTRSLPVGETQATNEAMSKQLAEEAMKKQLEKQKVEEDQLGISLRRMGSSRGLAPQFSTGPLPSDRKVTEGTPTDVRLSPEERKVEENITRGFLSSHSDEQAVSVNYALNRTTNDQVQLEIGLVHGGIQTLDYERTRTSKKDGADGDFGNYPVDVISVGHYIGVQPAAAEKLLDIAISAALKSDKPGGDPNENDISHLILTQYTNRGIIHGRLGQPFLMPDPRARHGKGGATTERIIAIVGMGEPGRFGGPELTVLARELCWSLGRLNKRHLATVLIGTGAGNLSLTEAVAAWMEGIRRALTGSASDVGHSLRRITFVEYDPSRIPEMDDLLKKEKKNKEDEDLAIEYFGPSPQKMKTIKEDGLEKAQNDLKNRWKKLDGNFSRDTKSRTLPTRVTLGLDAARKTYRFGAITDTASVPEREVTLDPTVVMQANDELAGEQKPAMQLERGRFLEELLIPDELRRQLYNNTAPLVMVLDATTARIHWEMVAQPELSPSLQNSSNNDGPGDFNPNQFLGTSRGFTRQLRTIFAPPPEPPPPPRRVLHVLVIADPAPDAHLPGAQEEGVAVADLFESYNTIYKDYTDTTRVEVTRLFGPLEATRTNVLRELLVRQYDVLHFAGHCVYRWGEDPALSGWVFNVAKKEVLSATELNRIDRIPKFVFSNACESGITPDRSEDRSVDLAPSFAEAFFARGVANFVCTAWPVDDVAAREFALTLYSGLLGIKVDLKNPGSRPVKGEAKMMHHAIKDARIQIASTSNGRTTWGAYQHYGNPYFEIFYSTPGQEHAPDPDGDRKALATDTGGTRQQSTKAAKGSRKSSQKSGAKGIVKSSRKSSKKSSKKS